MELLDLVLNHDTKTILNFNEYDFAYEFCKNFELYIYKTLNMTFQKPDFIVLNIFDENVSLAYDYNIQSLVVVKQIMHKDGKYNIPLFAIYELYTHTKLHGLNSKHLQRLVSVQIECDFTNIISFYLPISFPRLFYSKLMPAEYIYLKANELIKTIKLLHSNQISHRDIKSNNICFDNCGNLVLIDFDCSCAFSNIPRKTLPICTITCKPPELFVSQAEYNAYALDFWSAGCVIVEMFLGQPLFVVNKKTTEANVLEQIYLFLNQLNIGHKQLKRKMSSNYYEFIKGLFDLDVNSRVKHAHQFILT